MSEPQRDSQAEPRERRRGLSRWLPLVASVLVTGGIAASSARGLDLAQWLELSQHYDPFLRRLAVAALAQEEVYDENPESAFIALQIRAGDHDRRVSDWAGKALELIPEGYRDRRAGALITALRQDPRNEQAARTLLEIGEVAATAMGEALREREFPAKEMLARVLGNLPKRGPMELDAALQSADRSVRMAALVGVPILQAEASGLLPRLRELVSNTSDAELARKAAEALELVRLPCARSLIRQLCGDPTGEVFARELVELKTPAVEELIRDALQDPGCGARDLLQLVLDRE